MSSRSGIELPPEEVDNDDDEHYSLLNKRHGEYGSRSVLHSHTTKSSSASGGGEQQQQHPTVSFNFPSTASVCDDTEDVDDDFPTVSASSYGDNDEMITLDVCGGRQLKLPSIRKMALFFSLNVNIVITIVKLIAYIQSLSLSVLAALLDSVLDILSQLVLNYTEQHSSMQRSSAFYPAGASRLEPIGVLTCAALMGMASFEVLKESAESLLYRNNPLASELSLTSFWNMLAIIVVKLALLWLCHRGANKRVVFSRSTVSVDDDLLLEEGGESVSTAGLMVHQDHHVGGTHGGGSATDAGVHGHHDYPYHQQNKNSRAKAVVQLADPTLEALAQDHFNDVLSNSVAAAALLVALKQPQLWFLDPVGAIMISLYIIYSWYQTGREQIEHLTGKSAPEDLIDELKELAQNFDERMEVDVVRAYHFGPKFLVEIEVVMPRTTLLFESHDVGMELQYEIESREEVERCFVHIDYQQRPYDEHVVSKVPELREKYRPKRARSTRSL